MNDGITISVLSRAADVIADTNDGLSGPKLVAYCNTFAVDNDIRIPHAAYPFQAANKRTALLENLRAFPPEIQYSLLMELCADWKLRDNQDVQAIRQLIQQRYSHLDTGTPTPPTSFARDTIPPVTPADTVQHVAPAAPLSPPPLPEVPSKPYDIFLSYSHADESLMTLIREHLVLYDRMGQIRKWWDRKLLPGTPLDGAITNYLSSSDIILLFVSASFLASDYCYDVEMQQALRQHAEGRSVVVPVILRHCGWHGAPFGGLLALPTDGRPLTAWPDRDEAAKNIADGVMRIVAELQRKQLNNPTRA
jgi:TIR domain